MEIEIINPVMDREHFPQQSKITDRFVKLKM